MDKRLSTLSTASTLVDAYDSEDQEPFSASFETMMQFSRPTTTLSLLKLAVLALRMPGPSTLPTSAPRGLVLSITAQRPTTHSILVDAYDQEDQESSLASSESPVVVEPPYDDYSRTIWRVIGQATLILTNTGSITTAGLPCGSGRAPEATEGPVRQYVDVRDGFPRNSTTKNSNKDDIV